MEFILRQIHKARTYGWLYLANLFLAFHFFSVHYINSSFLSTFVPGGQIGLVFAAAAFLTLIAISTATLVMNAIGNYRTALFAAGLDAVACLGLVFATHPGTLLVFFALHTLLLPVILFTLDVFLETGVQDEESTGNARGIFLSVMMVAALFAPALSGILAGEENLYSRVYLAAVLFLVPFVIILVTKFRSFTDPVYRTFAPVRTLLTVLRDGDMFHIGMAQFLLRFFFSWTVIYLPLHLHENIGFTWPEIGLILFIMLVPYILIEWPAGILADGWLGEKELLAAGFVITALSTGALVFLSTPSIVLWSTFLFMTRAGCALIESMTETYFFKHVDGDDIDMIGFFRMLRPLAYIIGPLLATLMLVFVSLQYLWAILGLVMVLGVFHAYRLVDTR